jgi:F-type H+-transporting ATPase subunit b
MSLLTPEFGLVFWMLLCFLTVLFILGRYGWPVIIRMINKRGDYIEESLKAAHEANERLQNIKTEGEKILAEAKNEHINILKEAAKVKEQIISDAKNQAQVEAGKIIENARVTIQQEKENAIKDIRAQVAELSISIAEKVLYRELADEQSQIELIDKLLDEVNIAKP